MNEIEPIIIPPIDIRIQPIWEELVKKYQSKVVVKEGTLHFTEIFFFLAHTRDRSTIIHSIIDHLYKEKSEYSKKFNYEYRLLKSSLLEGFFGLRESLSGLVNCVFGLHVDIIKVGSSNHIYKKAKEKGLCVASYLDQIISKDSKLSQYLKAYRHPYVHREDLSNLSTSDLVAALVGAEQPRILDFIEDSNTISEWLRPIEKGIAQECALHLALT